MLYTVRRLASGSYDVLLDRQVIASLVQQDKGAESGGPWHVELLTNPPAYWRPAPFTANEHTFPSLTEAWTWLGIPIGPDDVTVGSLRND